VEPARGIHAVVPGRGPWRPGAGARITL